MKGQIIVMDDDKEYCEVMGEILHQLNYHGICVKDGNEVLQVFKESKQSGKKIDLIIMDLKVENGMSGEEAIRKLLEIDPTIKIIASSGYSSNPLITNFQRYGIKGILPKPFNIKDLIATLNRFL